MSSSRSLAPPAGRRKHRNLHSLSVAPGSPIRQPSALLFVSSITWSSYSIDQSSSWPRSEAKLCRGKGCICTSCLAGSPHHSLLFPASGYFRLRAPSPPTPPPNPENGVTHWGSKSVKVPLILHCCAFFCFLPRTHVASKSPCLLLRLILCFVLFCFCLIWREMLGSLKTHTEERKFRVYDTVQRSLRGVTCWLVQVH